MAQDTAFDSKEFVRAGIEELRRHLLDFSTRNRLLSFKHTERGTDYIRAVDELPGEIYQRLNGGRMRLLPFSTYTPSRLTDRPADFVRQCVSVSNGNQSSLAPPHTITSPSRCRHQLASLQ